MIRSCLALLLAAALLPACAARADGVWIEVDRPVHGATVKGPVPLLEVRGSAGTRGRGSLDLIVVIDASKSTRHSSGVDLNSDGHVGGFGFRHRRSLGAYLRAPLRSSDPADSILFAELEAVRRLANKMDPARVRLGVVAFADNAVVHSSVGAPIGELLRALEFIGNTEPYGRTNMARAIRVSAEALLAAEPVANEGVRRDRAIVLLSDGEPTVPSPRVLAAAEALEAAQQAGQRGVRIYTVGLAIPDADTTTLKEIAHAARGAYSPMDDHAMIVEALPNLDLQGIADVEIQNATTGSLARATHVWRDGTFGAFVGLVEGENVLIFSAHGANGALTSTARTIYFENDDSGSEQDRKLALERLKNTLQERRVRLAVQQEIEAAKQRKKLDRALDVEIED